MLRSGDIKQSTSMPSLWQQSCNCTGACSLMSCAIHALMSNICIFNLPYVASVVLEAKEERTVILACGDALIDLVARQERGRSVFESFPGGSVLNFAIALGRLGNEVAFVGGISSDMFGDAIIAHLHASNVQTDYADRLDFGSTLAFAKLTDGRSEYAFFDEQSAMRRWRMCKERFDGIIPTAVHIGSIALIDPIGFEQCSLLAKAYCAQAVVSLDPNCRPSLVRDANALTCSPTLDHPDWEFPGINDQGGPAAPDAFISDIGG
ncbi:PfkB family carbohydrate kinase, partial [Pelagibacterium lentulum]|uniref:PfkB family carbohydrate kinase n=1 Tax=Pelagibacterium lentulum TaxID=2029865 RepID=UPI001FCEC17B